MANKLLNAALAYAERGWYILPCKADKTPYTKHGVKDATIDRQIITGWWNLWPNANVAIDVGRSGFMVYDLDPGSSLKELNEALDGELPKTKLESHTPRGGQHLFYVLLENDVVPPSASKIAKHIDVRSDNSYVLLPPSSTRDGTYEWATDGEAAIRTDAMVRTAYTGQVKSADHDTWIIDQDIPENITLAIAWLQDRKRCKLAIQGEGGDDCTYATAAMMKSYGVSEAKSLELMWDHWNADCIPPWDYDELEIKVRNGHEFNTSQPGNMTPIYRKAKARELLKLEEIELEAGGKKWTISPYRAVDIKGIGEVKDPDWLLQDFIPENAYVMMYGPYSSFKSFIALDIALSVVTGGLSPLNLWGQVHYGNVLFAIGEGRSQFSKRIKVWQHNKIEGADATGLITVDPVPGITIDIEPFIEIGLAASPKGYKLVVLDTIGRAMQGMNENTQEHASAFTEMVSVMQQQFNCAVLALHHIGHQEKAGHARGSSVFGADTDTIIALSREDNSYKVGMEMQKQKDFEVWKADRWLKLEEISITDKLKSLVPVNTTPPAKGKEDEEGMLVVVRIVDQIIYDLLDKDRARAWTQTLLIDNIIPHDDMPDDLSDSVIKKYMKLIRRAKSGYKSSSFYDKEGNQSTGQWSGKNHSKDV